MGRSRYHTLYIYCTLALYLWITGAVNIYSQEISHPVASTGIYEFIDELAAEGVISVNQVIKPFSRSLIASLLEEASGNADKLSVRQIKELEFYLRDFGKEGGDFGSRGKRKDLFWYSDSLFSLTVNPIAGGEFFMNGNSVASYWRNGLEARSYIGKWGFYASLRDNHEKPLLGLPEYLTHRQGGHIKNSTDWSEMQGGVTYSWKWGSAGLVKDQFTWGSGHHGTNIFSGRNPSFVRIALKIQPVKWFTFNYFHGWLNSMVVDSARSYYVTNSYGTDYREVYHKKFIAANMFTVIPVPDLYLSAGNSIIYSDIGFNPSYLVPLFFYKSVDHSVNSGIGNMNSQMFFDISSYQLKHLHLYATLFVDELSVGRIFKKDEWNFVSWKAGMMVSGLPLKDLSFTAEYTYSYPLAFQHFVPTLTFESNGYNLGHYLKDNSREWYFAINYSPVRCLDLRLWYSDQVRGPDYSSLGGSRIGNPPLETIEWQSRNGGIRIDYQPLNDLYVWSSFSAIKSSGEPDWSPEFISKSKIIVNTGITFGF